MSKQKWEKLFDENFGDFGDPITFIETSRRLGINIVHGAKTRSRNRRNMVKDFIRNLLDDRCVNCRKIIRIS